MASDLRMEIFAFKIFHKCWCDYEELKTEPEIIRIYGDECAADNSYLEACDDEFYKAITARHCLMSNFYYLSTELAEEVRHFTSMSEVCDYVIDACNKDDLFGYLSVFERMLVTSDYVMSLCYMIYLEVECLKDVLKYSHIFWAMYFDKFTEEFYENGGWDTLKIVSQSYRLLTDLFDILGLKTLWGTLKFIKESQLNHGCFKRFLELQKGIESERKRCVAMHWISFSIAFFNGRARMPLKCEEYATANDVHYLLEDVRYCCDPTLLDKIYAKKTIKKSPVIEKANTFDNSHIDNAFNNEISDVEFDTSKNVDSAHFKKNIPTETKMTLNINPDVEMAVNSHHKQKVLGDLTTHRETVENQKLPKIVDDNSTSTLDVNKNVELKNSSNSEEQSKKPIIVKVFPVNEKDECYKDSDSRGFCNPKDIAPRNECVSSANETINTKQELEGNFVSKGQIETTKAKHIESVNQMTASTCDVISSTDTVDEPESIQKAREDLRKEQNDPDMQMFFRLILLLGDKQRLKSLLATSSGCKGSSANLQKKLNNKKKKIQKNSSN